MIRFVWSAQSVVDGKDEENALVRVSRSGRRCTGAIVSPNTSPSMPAKSHAKRLGQSFSSTRPILTSSPVRVGLVRRPDREVRSGKGSWKLDGRG